MTSWAAPGSPIRYYQCPFCARTHASCYGEAFRKGAGARRAATPGRSAGPMRPASPDHLPQASQDDIRWAGVKARAAKWFARLEAEETGRAPARRQTAPASQLPVRATAVVRAR